MVMLQCYYHLSIFAHSLIMTDAAEIYMKRCLELAQLGAGRVAPNPMVGSLLVHRGRILGEGYHQQYGQAHAEVNCLESVAMANKHLIPFSTLYVSLEPCAHQGKTPACTLRIIAEKIPVVVIGCRDPYSKVNGKGIAQLKEAGIQVTEGVLETECRTLNQRFFTFQEQKRPYVLLKWAQTADHFLAGDADERLLISNAFTNRLTHGWRREEAAIIVGTRTALKDDPSLDNRWAGGPSPVRMVIDKSGTLPDSLQLLNGKQRTIVFNFHKHKVEGLNTWYQLHASKDLIPQILDACYQLQLQSLLVEGGAKLLQSFLNHGIWDEARVITNTAMHIGTGLPAPLLPPGLLCHTESFLSDTIAYYRPSIH